jgi:flagellar M-ring protein FliF
MPGNQPNFINQLLEMWSRLQWPQRLTIIFFAFLGMALISSIVYFVNRVEYEVLYTDLSPEDAQALQTKLDEDKKDFIIKGTSILVKAPKTEIGKLQVKYYGLGIAKSGKIGFEIFDKNQLGMTEFTEKVNLQRAYAGELSRTISSISEVSRAQVSIVLPKESYFDENKEDAKASVFLDLKKGAELSKSSIAGIKAVVAGTVPGMHIRNVSIVDAEGKLLAQSVESGEDARAERESGIREQLEKEMSGKVVSILEPLVGIGKVHANASIDLDFNSAEQTEETVNPNTSAILSQQKSEERAGGQSGAAGIPGTASNVGSATPQTSPSSPERVRQSEATNYEFNKLVRHTIQPKGAVRRLSVAVILDHKTVWNKAKDGKVTSHTEPISTQEITAYRDLVLAAVGYSEQRGDVVKVENVAFYNDTKPEEPSPATPWYNKWQSQPYVLPGMKYVALIILFFVVYFIFIRPVRNRVFQALSIGSPELSESGEAALVAGGVPKALNGATQAEQIAASEGGDAAALPAGETAMLEDTISLETASDEQIERELIREASSVDMGNRKYTAMKKKLTDKAKKDPEMISQLIRTLLREKA